MLTWTESRAVVPQACLVGLTTVRGGETPLAHLLAAELSQLDLVAPPVDCGALRRTQDLRFGHERYSRDLTNSDEPRRENSTSTCHGVDSCRVICSPGIPRLADDVSNSGASPVDSR